MNAAAPTSLTSATSTPPSRGHIGVVVLASVAAGIVFGLLLVLGVFAGGSEPQIIGSALFALGAGFALLAFTSTHRTNQRQRLALVPGRGFPSSKPSPLGTYLRGLWRFLIDRPLA